MSAQNLNEDKYIEFELIKQSEKDVFLENMPRRGGDFEPTPGVKMVFTGDEQRGLDISPVIEFSVSVAKDIALGVFANWLYDKLKGKTFNLVINRKKVQISPEAIQKAVEKEIQAGN